MSLRSKLLLVSLVVLLLPWLGVRYIQAFEGLLQQQQADAMTTLVKASSIVLEQNESLFEPYLAEYKNGESDVITVVDINNPIHIDGYNDEWLTYYSLLKDVPLQNQLNKQPVDPQDISARYFFARTKQRHLGLFIDVVDDDLVFRQAGMHQRHGNDALVLAIENEGGEVQRFILSSSAFGRLNAYEFLGSYNDPLVIRQQPQIKAVWQRSTYGYRIEISLPPSIDVSKIAFAVIDKDDHDNSQIVIGVGDVRDRQYLQRVKTPSQALGRLLSDMAQAGVRMWLVDQQLFKVATAGVGEVIIEEPQLIGFWDTFYSFFLTQPTSDDESISHEQAVFNSEIVKVAFNGEVSSERRQLDNSHQVVIAAAHPVKVQGDVIGVLVAEKNTNSILAIQNAAMKNLLETTLIVLAIFVVVLLGFASRLSFRINRLNKDIANAVNSEGRLAGSILERQELDELGQLRNSFATLFERVSHYNHYLEALASRLAHELRTPIAVIKTSLEHLEGVVDKEAEKYIARAHSGSDRVNNIVARMTEAARLEQAVAESEFQKIDMSALLVELLPIYKDIYPQVQFELDEPKQSVMIYGSKELIAQMLDKLINNAVDFHQQNTAIGIGLHQVNASAMLSIKNMGPCLPEQIETQLFQPMVSMRQSRADDNQAHLGIGLYIVKLIVEAHSGSVKAQNWSQGVEILIDVPIASV